MRIVLKTSNAYLTIVGAENIMIVKSATILMGAKRQ
jgi:hypothetical protein